MEQMFDIGIDFDYIVTASGSAGTHAGLAAGLKGNNANIPLLGTSVSRKAEEQKELVYNLSSEICKLLRIENPEGAEDIIVFDDYVGKGYGYPTQEMVEAVQLLARTEAILVDPVYSGKTLAGMMDLINKGYLDEAERILFIHTGGTPALYAYEDVMLHGIEE